MAFSKDYNKSEFTIVKKVYRPSLGGANSYYGRDLEATID